MYKVINLIALLLVATLALENSSVPPASLLSAPGENRQKDALPQLLPLEENTATSSSEPISVTSQTWTDIAKPATTPDRLSAGVVYNPMNDKIYLYGGATAGAAGDRVNLCQEYDPVNNTWTNKTAMANRRNWIKGFWTKNNKLYAIGGINEANTFLTVNQEFDPDANTWTTKAPLPAARAAYLGGVWRDSLIYLMGGLDASSVGRTEVYIYDPWSNTWTTGTPLPRAGDMGDAVIVGDTIFITNAWNRPGSSCWPNLVKGAINPDNPTQITWIDGPAFPAPTMCGGAAALGRDVYWLAGFLGAQTVTNRWWKYDGTTGAIVEMTPLYPVTLARNCYMCSRPSEYALYVIAGDEGGNWSAPNQRYAKIVLRPPPAIDMGVDAIRSPATLVNPGAIITPIARIKNFGTAAQSNIPVYCWIDSAGTRIYGQNVTFPGPVNPNDTALVSFPDWLVGPTGATYQVRMFTDMPGDENRANDTTKRTVSVVPTGVREIKTNPLREIKINNPLRMPLVLTNTSHLEVYDATGTIIQEINQPSDAGCLVWNGKDKYGRTIPNGIYFLKIRSDNGLLTTKAIVLR